MGIPFSTSDLRGSRLGPAGRHDPPPRIRPSTRSAPLGAVSAVAPGSVASAIPLEALRGGLLDEALAIVRDRRGVDFGGYRRATIERRLLNRILCARVPSAAAYLARLRASDGETDRLIATLTVKVSRFFRNAPVFEALRDLVRTDLRERFGGPGLRVWSAGCGNGEEAYTLAMVLGDTPGEVWGTDVDASALAEASAGRYPEEALRELPAALGEAGLERAGPATVRVRDHVRRRVRFMRHDLAGADAPPEGARFHLVCCRNVVIYFEPAVQRRAMQLVVDGLAPGGVLCLGEAEWEGDLAWALEPIDRRRKLYRRRGPEAARR